MESHSLSASEIIDIARMKKAIKSLVGSIAGAAGIYQHNFRSKMTIIAFHRVNDTLPSDGLTCDSAKFTAFCEFFRKYFRVVRFAEQVAGCRSGVDMGGTLSITFDDGYLDNFAVAAPILKRMNLPATFFITTGFIESKRVPPWDERLPFQPGWMTWNHIRELSALGFDIGAHTETHINMGASDPGAVRAELHASKEKLQHELGKPVDLFAYPFGGPAQISQRALELVREAGFISCASCYGGTNPPIADPYNLKRIGIAEWFRTPHQFGLELLIGKS